MLIPLLLALGLSVPAEVPPVHRGTEGRVQVKPPRLENEAVVDGVLDEPMWAEAPVLTGFSQYAPADGRPSDAETAVRVWYSPTALYFGIRAQGEPASVRATLSSRDRIDTDDQIQIYLSPFNDGRQALLFAVNPLGVQADGVLVEGTRSATRGFSGLATGRELPDLSPDFVFQSKGRVTDSGFEIEVRIPFKSVRSPSVATQDWGVQVVRVRKAVGVEDTWTVARRAASSFPSSPGRWAARASRCCRPSTTPPCRRPGAITRCSRSRACSAISAGSRRPPSSTRTRSTVTVRTGWRRPMPVSCSGRSTPPRSRRR